MLQSKYCYTFLQVKDEDMKSIFNISYLTQTRILDSVTFAVLSWHGLTYVPAAPIYLH